MGIVQSTGWLRLTAAMLYGAAPCFDLLHRAFNVRAFGIRNMSEQISVTVPANGVTGVPWRG